MSFRRLLLPALSWTLLAAASPSHSTPPHIEWVDCANNVPIYFTYANITIPTKNLPSTLHCGKIVVPMDYAKPISSSNNITLSVSMYRPSKPKGVIFYNGGGSDPNTVVAWAVALGSLATFDELLDYDLMMMDSRGTFDSNALNISDVGLEAVMDLVKPFPRTQKAFNAVKESSALFIKDIEKWTNPPGIVKYVSAKEVAQDYEQIRIALGYEKINFVALSYGTFRAQQYAYWYPERVGNFVLDAPIPHGITPYTQAQNQISALNRVMYRADAFCLHNTSCPFHRDGKGGVIKAYKKLLASAPLLVPSLNATVTALNIQQAVATDFESEGVDFPTLFQNIKDGLSGDATSFAASPAFPANLNVFVAGTILLECGDNNFQTTTFAEWETSLNAGLAPQHDVNQISQSDAWELQLGCLSWPYPTPAYAPLITHVPMLIVTSDYDGGAPTEWAEVYLAQAHNSVLAVRHGDDHTTFSLTDQPATALMNQFLKTGKLPKAMSNSRVSVYTQGMKRAPIPDPYCVPTGEIAGDVNSGNLTGDGILP